MTKHGRIKDISEYHRYNDGYKNKRKGLIMFIEFTQDYRDFVQNNGSQKTQSQGMVVEYRTDDCPSHVYYS